MDNIDKAVDQLVSGVAIEETKIVDMPSSFWVVTRPTKRSRLSDIVFETDYRGLVRQGKGGLSSDDIIAIYKSGDKAKAHGKKLLKTDNDTK